jgi:VIT1/CCC1 family predicted Fe2+/Mn2+ transporter
MSSETSEPSEQDADIPPTPFPDSIVFTWLAVLEGLIAASLVVFSIAILEAGEIIPNVLEETSVGLGTFIVVTLVAFALKMR